MQELGFGSPLGDSDPIVIRKKPRTVQTHHSGAWKVAFADFVTAMMALFMVMWLMSADERTKQAVSAYFSDPKGFAEQLGNGQGGIGSGLSLSQNDLKSLADQIHQAMEQMPQFDALSDNVSMTVTGEGLRIELLEDELGAFFQSGSPSPTGQGRDTLQVIGRELTKLPNPIVIEGHTDSKPFRGKPDYTNWELSADRANSARRILIEGGLPEDQIVQVRGFAAMELRRPEAPEDPSNRRISLIVKYGR